MENENNAIKQRQDKNKAALVEQLRKTPIIEVTCKKLGIGRATFYRWRKEDSEFTELAEQALDEGLSTVSDLAESKLITAIQNDNLTATIFWLKSRHQAYKTRVELSTTERPKEELSTEQQEEVKRVLALSELRPIEINEDNEKPKQQSES